jgi:serine/threonine protein kinase/Tol biopolymer transport system component
MTLSLHDRLGPYEVLGSLGAGGMGEVYRARDTRLGREVAIKVLPGEFFTDSERLKRFEREASSASALNHPNIITVHQIEQFGSTPLIVMELVLGKTLRQLLLAGRLPTKKSLSIAAQVADGLACAHEAGIVHRDLKPENLMVTKDGRVKIVDFGLAKIAPVESVRPSHRDEPTMTMGTMPGIVLGTVGYMSPEQASGQQTDYRSDQFSFGSILYEMMTGRHAFHRKTGAETLAAIIREEPEPIELVNPSAPAALRWIVERCLSKDPEDRYVSTRDLARDLAVGWQHASEITGTSGSVPKVGPPEAAKRPFVWPAAAVALGALMVVLVLILSQFQRTTTAENPTRFWITPPESGVFHSLGYDAGPMTLSPDGRRIAFVASDPKGKSSIWVRPLDALIAAEIAGTEGASFPFWSWDSRFLGFFADGKLKKIEVAVGTAETLCEVQDARGGTWNREGVILFSPARNRLIYRVSSSGGSPIPVTQLNTTSEIGHRFPFFLPDGRHFLYSARDENGANEILVASLDSKERKSLVHASSNAVYSPPGYLLFVQDGNLVAQPFDAKRLKTTGEPLLVAKEVRYFSLVGKGVFSVSENGVLAYQSGPAAVGSQLLWFDRAGKQIGSTGVPANYGDPRISPDGKKIAMTVADPQTGNPDIWIYDLPRDVTTRFTFGAAWDIIPIWSPDGSRVLFSSNRGGLFDLYVKAFSKTAEDEMFLTSKQHKWPDDWSGDGRFIAFDISSAGGMKAIWILPLFGDRKPFAFERSEFSEFGAAFSPDGRWLAYVSEESGGREVYLQSFPDRGEKLRISIAGGVDPKWRADGRELFYQALNNQLMAVKLETGGRLTASSPTALFKMNPTSINDIYDVAPDGQSFLVNTVSREDSSPITVVLNWAAGLK